MEAVRFWPSLIASCAVRILPFSGGHLLVLSDSEIQSLVDACALLILVTGEVPGFRLQPDTARLIVDLIGQPRAGPSKVDSSG
jgi:hypothetical protein